MLFTDKHADAGTYRALIDEYTRTERMVQMILGGKTEELSSFIAEQNIDVNRKDRDKYPPLYYAVNSNNTETMEILQNNKADPNVNIVENPYITTQPLYVAIAKKNPAACSILLKNGADLSSRAFIKTLPAQWVIYQNAYEVMPVFTEHGVQFKELQFVNKDGTVDSAIDYAKKNNQQEVLKYLESLK